MTDSTAMVIEVEQRSSLGSSAVGKLRREGKIPGIVYGGAKGAVAIAVAQRPLEDLLRHGGHRLVRLRIGGEEEQGDAMVKEVQSDPISGLPLHVDFIRIESGHKVHITVEVVLKGDCVGVRHGGRLDFPSRMLALEVLPNEMIDLIEVDVSELEVGEHVTVADLAAKLPPSGKLLEDAHRVVVLVERPRAAPVEGEAEAAPAAAEKAEPELIKTKGKAEEEGD
jgi:large subunit ribosomal protein L25